MKEVLRNKKIIVGVTGSIAAYKSANLVRELKKAGAEVFVMMTPASANFITPLTLANLSRNPVSIEMFDKEAQRGGAWHIQLAHECDLMIIAPCSASTLSKLANGNCDNALVTVATALPRKTPLIIAPAMDSTMFLNPSTQRNIETLKNDGYIIIPPEDGDLSSGIVGPGRLPDIYILMSTIIKALRSDGKLRKKTIMITAGPTVEKIDDVRFVSNFSTGLMGYSLAEAASDMGAKVILISGPTNLTPPDNVELIKVTSADEMYQAATTHFPKADISILSAAVADFTPEGVKKGKLKKDDFGEEMVLKLVKTKDILADLGSKKKGKQLLIGFALETDNLIDNAKKKLVNKNCDMIVLNEANKPNSGFGVQLNTITILSKDGSTKEYPPQSKYECAENILLTALALSLNKV